MNINDNNSRINFPDCPFYLPRPRLHHLLDRHLQVKLMTVVGEPGYGKTTLISSYLQERKLPAVWYQLHESDRSSDVFLSHLQTALAKQLKKRSGHPRLPAFIHTGVDELLYTLSSWPGELYVVLDHVHLLESGKGLLQIIERLLEETPQGIRFILIGQLLPSLPYAQYKLRRNYGHLSGGELAFTEEEIASFFADMPAAPLEPGEVEFLLHETEGWPASLELIRDAIQGKDREERDRVLQHFREIPHLYAYMDREVLKLQQPEIRSFLLRTSILRELDLDVVRQYLGPAVQEFPELLIKRFTLPAGREGTLRYHKLFRSFLLEHYRKETGRASINEDHLKLSAIYEDKHQFFDAFAHSILGRDFVRAGRLMRGLQIRYQPQEFIELLRGWLGEFFTHHFIESSIFLYRCVPISSLHNLIELLEQGLISLDNRKQQMWAAMVRQQLAGIHKLVGHLSRARTLSEEALRVFERVHDQPMIMLCLNFQSDLLLNMGEPAEAKSRAQRCLFLTESLRDMHFHPYALSGMADTLIEDGTPEAVEYLEQALEGSPGKDDALQFFLYCSRSKLYNLVQDTGLAVEWAQKTVKLAGKFGFLRDIGLAHIYLARAYVSAGMLAEAAPCLETAYEALQSFKFLLAHVVAAQYELLKRQKADEDARLKLVELQELCGIHDYPWIVSRYREEMDALSATAGVRETAPMLQIEVLGPLAVRLDGQPIQVRRKASLRLLLYLIVNHPGRIPQDMIIEELFGNQPLGAAQNQLYVALSVLRSALEPGRNPGRNSRYVKNVDGLYSLDSSLLDLDYTGFLKRSGDMEDIDNLMLAERLYKGDLLEEYRYESFIEGERERLRIRYLQILTRLAGYFAEQGDYYRSMEYYERLCAKDPYNRKGFQAYMNMLNRFGMDAQALAVKERMRNISLD